MRHTDNPNLQSGDIVVNITTRLTDGAWSNITVVGLSSDTPEELIHRAEQAVRFRDTLMRHIAPPTPITESPTSPQAGYTAPKCNIRAEPSQSVRITTPEDVTLPFPMLKHGQMYGRDCFHLKGTRLGDLDDRSLRWLALRAVDEKLRNSAIVVCRNRNITIEVQ